MFVLAHALAADACDRRTRRLMKYARYNAGPRGRARSAVYEATPKGRDRVTRYRVTAKGIFASWRAELNARTASHQQQLALTTALARDMGMDLTLLGLE